MTQAGSDDGPSERLLEAGQTEVKSDQSISKTIPAMENDP